MQIQKLNLFERKTLEMFFTLETTFWSIEFIKRKPKIFESSKILILKNKIQALKSDFDLMSRNGTKWKGMKSMAFHFCISHPTLNL